ncbi:MAG TPA: hypothetical protein VLS93_01430 [Anaeromyxobacteraceae bacterium]|nr:hypothetical protein [Anaeromyxobacteraceae bacterium]
MRKLLLVVAFLAGSAAAFAQTLPQPICFPAELGHWYCGPVNMNAFASCPIMDGEPGQTCCLNWGSCYYRLGYPCHACKWLPNP